MDFQKMDQLSQLPENQLDVNSPTPGAYYYKEGPYYVFTELYSFQKGGCCGCGCRHCAWEKGK